MSVFIRVVFVLLCMTATHLHAGEVYKWTDENGRVHYGDKNTAPPSSQAVTTPNPSKPAPVEQKALATPKKLSSPYAKLDPKEVSEPWKPKGVPVDPTLVKPRCNELGQTVSETPAGKPFKHMTDEIISLCPGVGYECRRYRKHPQDNVCVAVARSGSDPMVKTIETD